MVEVGGRGERETSVRCDRCGRRFGVAYAPDVAAPGRWMTPVRCPHCRRAQVVAFSPAALHLTVHA